MANTPISRQEKDKMRARLEDVLKMQKELVKKIELITQETGITEYQTFLNELQKNHSELNRKVYNYMVRKCNR